MPHSLGSKNSCNQVRERSIAVLPFDSLSDKKRDAYFADGIHDEILSNLAKVSQLKVISRTSVMTYRARGNRDLRSIASALGVAQCGRRHGAERRWSPSTDKQAR